MTFFTPYIVYGEFKDRNGTAIVGATITAKNIASGDEITTLTGLLGRFTLDIANFANGYYNGDKIELTGVSSSDLDYDLLFSLDAGLTWQQIENDTQSVVNVNTTRFKLNQTVYQGGRTDLNIVLIA